ncbi:MAG: patatin-like phospholipase family protein, partial [Xanthomonadales bacterium]|nr:patatin-like phospholipase family protein [Xanthomonadales bacterium]
GAIIGSLYAVGYSADEIEAIVAAIDWKDILRDDPKRIDMPMRRKQEDFRYLLDLKLGLRNGRVLLPRGVVQGQKLNLLLRRLLLPAWNVERFDDLPIPFRCVGTDIGAGQGVVFDHGDLATAVRASMSVPGAFAPIRV